MLYMLCVTCDENFVVEEPEQGKPLCPKCRGELGVLGIALMWDKDELESVERERGGADGVTRRKRHGSGYVVQFICTACLSAYLGEMPVWDPSCPRCGGMLWPAGVWDLMRERQPSWWEQELEPDALEANEGEGEFLLWRERRAGAPVLRI